MVCEVSLCCLCMEYFDVYLLYWWGWYLFVEMLGVMEELVDVGKIWVFGVLNFDVFDLDEVLWVVKCYFIVCN